MGIFEAVVGKLFAEKMLMVDERIVACKRTCIELRQSDLAARLEVETNGQANDAHRPSSTEQNLI